jgi:hypothetical protein
VRTSRCTLELNSFPSVAGDALALVTILRYIFKPIVVRLASALVLCFWISLLAPSGLASDGPPSMTGRWRSVEVNAAGLGSTIEFRDDGTLDFSPATAVNLPYRVEGETLVLSPSGGAEQKQSMVWVNDSKLVLVQKTGDAQGEIVLVRATSAAGEPRSLVGEWTTQIKMQERTVTARYIFRKDGNLLLLVSLITQSGIYRTAGAHLHWELPEQPPADGDFKIEGEILTIPKPGGGELKYKRY